MVAENIIRRVVTRIMVPFIQLYALYVIVHGDSGPGGGFQGGVILGASIILYTIIFGRRAARKRLPVLAGDIFSSVGVLIYAGVGIACLFFGGNYLQYNVLPFHSPHLAGHMGIFFIEIGVGVTVAAVMASIYFEMSNVDRGKQEADED